MTLSMKGLLLGCPLGVLKMSISIPFTTLQWHGQARGEEGRWCAGGGAGGRKIWRGQEREIRQEREGKREKGREREGERRETQECERRKKKCTRFHYEDGSSLGTITTIKSNTCNTNAITATNTNHTCNYNNNNNHHH